MLLGKAYNVCIVSLYDWSDIADELQIVNNVLNDWNRKHANKRKRFFFFNFNTFCNDENNDDKFKNSDLLIVIFLTKSGNPIIRPDEKNGEKAKNLIELIKNRGKSKESTLIYFIEKISEYSSYNLCDDIRSDILDAVEKYDEVHFEPCSEENFEFDFTCDICAFDNFNNTTSIEFGVVDIKVKNSEKQDNKYDLEYLATFLVNSPERPIKYRDRISTQSGTIKPDFKLIKDGDYICDPPEIDDNKQLKYIEYEVKPTPEKEKDELFFTGKIEIVDRTENWFGLHIPYNAKYLIINVDVSQINMETVSAELEGEKNFKKLYDEKNKTYIFKTENVRKDSDIIFKLEQKNDK